MKDELEELSDEIIKIKHCGVNSERMVNGVNSG